MMLLFSMKNLNETRVVLLLSMKKLYMAFVGVGINLKLLYEIYCFYLKEVKVKYLEMSNGSLLSKQGLTPPE